MMHTRILTRLSFSDECVFQLSGKVSKLKFEYKVQKLLGRLANKTYIVQSMCFMHYVLFRNHRTLLFRCWNCQWRKFSCHAAEKIHSTDENILSQHVFTTGRSSSTLSDNFMRVFGAETAQSMDLSGRSSFLALRSPDLTLEDF